MAFLNPTSVAVIGASRESGKVGHDIFKNLVTQGYQGEVYPVNPKGGEILGKKVYASVKEIEGDVDMAVIVIPAKLVAAALEECGAKKVKTVVVISAGFGEVHTEEGTALEKELAAVAKKHDINLIGPNCLGVVRPGIGMNASFAKDLPPSGSIAVVSQSGAMGVALMDSAIGFGMGLSAFVSIGNKAVLDESDMLEELAKDEATSVIGFYLESIKDGRAFLEAARRVSQSKPIVLLKAGVSAHGAKAAQSHTGALAGSDSAIDALCTQANIHRAHTAEEFLDLLSVLSMEPKLLSRNIAIITNAGGPGILATDAAEREKLGLPSLAPATIEQLKPKLPASASMANPIDVIGDAGADRYEAALLACREDPNIDGVVIVLTPQVMTPCKEIAQTIARIMKTAPLMPVVTAFMGGESVRQAKKILREAGIPTFATPERAVHAIATLACHPEDARTGDTRSASWFERPHHDTTHFDQIQKMLNGKKGLLDEQTTADLFAHYDLPLPKQAIAKTTDEAVKIASEIGYPVIAKISSPDILHKTDIGGVRANLKTADEVKKAFEEIMQNAGAHSSNINGVLIQQFLPVGNEFIVGCVRDPSFGPLIMAGLGGIYTELFRDTAFRIAPLAEADAYAMLQELQSWKLLLGMRGKSQSDIDALARVLLNVSRMVMENPEITELDLNPVLVSEKGIIIADAKVVL